MRLQLLSGTYSAKSIIANAQRCVNLYPEINPPETQAPVPVTHYQRAGLTLLASPPAAGMARCAYRSTLDTLYYVVGPNVYSVSPTWGFTLLGTIASLKTPVSMVDNGTDIFIVDGTTAGYTIKMATNAFATVSDPAYYGSPAVQMVDGYFVFAKPGTNIMYISLNQSTGFDSLDFAAKNGFPDHLSSLAIMHREIWLIGELTSEVWYNTGASDFTFGQIPGCFIEQGCVAPYSVAKQDLSVYWLSQDLQGKLMVLEGNGYKAGRISNHAMEAQIQTYATYSDAIGMTYQYEGHTFYHLTFPTADKTWVFDVSTRQWHEETWTDSNGQEHRHRANCAANVYGKNIVGDWENGNIYELDTANFTDFGGPIVFRRGFPHIVSDSKRMYHRQFVADMAVGAATTLLWNSGNFLDNTFTSNDKSIPSTSAFALSRASTATYFDASGKMVTAAANELRIDHDPLTGAALGALIEDEAKNYITNNTMAGAAAGTPGTLPDNWIAALNGLSQEVVGFAQEDGIDYIDLRLNSDLDLTGLPFSRASTATYFDASGVLQTAAADALRDAYDPISHAYLGKIVEGSAATNLLEYDEEFDNNSWFKTGCSVTAGASNGVDGTATMDKMVEDTSTGTHFVTAAVAEAITGGTQCVAAIDLKKAERTHAAVALMNNSASPFENATVFIDLDTGEASMAPSGVTNAAFSVEQLPDGIWRVLVTCLLGSTVTLPSLVVWTSDGTSTSYTGDGASGIYLDRAQLEIGTMPTSFIKTTGAVATRAADVLSIPYSDLLWNQDALAVEFVGQALPGWSFIDFGQFDGGEFNQLGTFRWSIDATGAAFYVQEPGGAEYSVFATATVDLNQPVTARFFWNGTTIGVSVNGGESVTHTMSVPASDFDFTRFVLGAGSWFGQAGAIIKSVKIIPSWAAITFPDSGNIYSDGPTATVSAYTTMRGGSLTGIGDVLLANRALLSPSGFTDEYASLRAGLLSETALKSARYQIANTPAGSLTGNGDAFILLDDITDVLDITLRIGLPQMELGNVATSPIKTSSAAVTRAADTLTLNATGRNDWTLTLGDGSTKTIANVSGNLVVDQASLGQSLLRSYLAATPDQTPTVSLRWSDTRGASWGNPIQTSMGSTGQYLVSMQYQRLGMARDRVYELFWSAPFKTALNGAWIDVKAGAT